MISILPRVPIALVTLALAVARAGADLAPAPAVPAGTTPAGAADAASGGAPAPVELSIAEAIRLGLANNLNVLLASSAVSAARGAELEALARELPHLSGDLAAGRQVLNLEAYGFPVAPGESPLVGPFNVVDYRARLATALVDLSARDAHRAAVARAEAARGSAEAARDLVVLATGNLYLQALAERGRIEAAAAEVATAESVDRLARDRHDAGSATALDVLRADAELETARARETAARSDFEKAKLLLARTIGLASDAPIELTGALTFAPLEALVPETILPTAWARRGDLKAAEAAVAAAELAARSAREARWPSLAGSADWGKIGPTAGSALSTWSVGVGLHIPLFEGRALEGRAIEADAEVARRKAERDDLRREIDFEVRSALLDLATAGDEVRSAETTRDLARRALEVARDRYAAGVGSNLDVIAAEQTAAAADEAVLARLYQHNAAKAALARALGLAEEAFTAFLEGKTDELRQFLAGPRSDR